VVFDDHDTDTGGFLHSGRFGYKGTVTFTMVPVQTLNRLKPMPS
jgi:hypothetical protein